MVAPVFTLALRRQKSSSPPYCTYESPDRPGVHGEILSQKEPKPLVSNSKKVYNTMKKSRKGNCLSKTITYDNKY